MTPFRAQAGDHNVWVLMDETTDASSRHASNVVIGALQTDDAGTPILLSTDVLENVNLISISRLCSSLEPRLLAGIRYKILLLLTDATPYMIKPGKGLQILCPKIIHVTSVTHAMHRVAEKLWLVFPKVDSFVSNIEKGPLPPRPILTRWGTCVTTVRYYSQSICTLKFVLEEITEDAASIKMARALPSDVDIEGNLAYIDANFTVLEKGIEVGDSWNVTWL